MSKLALHDPGCSRGLKPPFEPHYNATAKPFDWTFTRADLADLLTRLDTPRPAGTAALVA